MLYEYAMTPDVFDAELLASNREALSALRTLLFEMSRDGQLADLNAGTWVQRVTEALLPRVGSTSVRRDLQELLEQLDRSNRLVRFPRSVDGVPKSQSVWLDLALEAHGAARFDAIFLSEELLAATKAADPALTHLSVAPHSKQWRSRKRSRTVVMDAVGYREALEPMLRHARVVRLIDLFLRPSRQYALTVNTVAELLGKRGETERPGRVEIHTRELAGYAEPARSLDEWSG